MAIGDVQKEIKPRAVVKEVKKQGIRICRRLCFRRFFLSLDSR
jgi:hypothetical protein